MNDGQSYNQQTSALSVESTKRRMAKASTFRLVQRGLVALSKPQSMLTSFGPEDVWFSDATDINNHGEIVGVAGRAGIDVDYVYRWRDGTTSRVDLFDEYPLVSAIKINDHGDIVCYFSEDYAKPWHIVAIVQGKEFRLDSPNCLAWWSQVRGERMGTDIEFEEPARLEITNSGWVYGGSVEGSAQDIGFGFTWQPLCQDFATADGFPVGYGPLGYLIADDAEICFDFHPSNSYWPSIRPRVDISEIGCEIVVGARGINEQGTVFGFDERGGFTWENGYFTGLDTSNFENSVFLPTDLNDSGVGVGWIFPIKEFEWFLSKTASRLSWKWDDSYYGEEPGELVLIPAVFQDGIVRSFPVADVVDYRFVIPLQRTVYVTSADLWRGDVGNFPRLSINNSGTVVGGLDTKPDGSGCMAFVYKIE